MLYLRCYVCIFCFAAIKIFASYYAKNKELGAMQYDVNFEVENVKGKHP